MLNENDKSVEELIDYWSPKINQMLKEKNNR
jgi:hypothetical protein